MLNNVIKFPRKAARCKIVKQTEAAATLLDINRLVTKGKDGVVAYPVTGYSSVEEIKIGYLIFVDPNKKASLDETKVFFRDGKTYVHKFVEDGFAVVGHLAIYN
jgi:phage repressor protein C with HTH and peptisase S24 domain